jgi:hypothetical protein
MIQVDEIEASKAMALTRMSLDDRPSQMATAAFKDDALAIVGIPAERSTDDQITSGFTTLIAIMGRL